MCLIAICLQSLFRSHLNSTAHTGNLVHAKQHRTILRPHSGPLNTDVHPLLSGPPLQISLGAHTGPYPSALSRAQASGRHRAQPQGGGKQHGQYSPSSAVHSHSCRDAPLSSPRTHGRRLSLHCASCPIFGNGNAASRFSLFQAEQPQFLLPLLRGSISQPSVIFITLLWPLSKILYLV